VEPGTAYTVTRRYGSGGGTPRHADLFCTSSSPVHSLDLPEKEDAGGGVPGGGCAAAGRS
jgi:hypothetical protein